MVAGRRRQAQAAVANARLEGKGVVASSGADHGQGDNPAKRRRVDYGIGDGAMDQGIDLDPSQEGSIIGGTMAGQGAPGDFLQGSPLPFGEGPLGDVGDDGDNAGALPSTAKRDLASSPGVFSPVGQMSQPVAIGSVVEVAASETLEGKAFKMQLANAWDKEAASVSFAEAMGPWASPEAVACSFVAMLGLCDEGVLLSSQEEAFSPIVLTHGPSWA